MAAHAPLHGSARDTAGASPEDLARAHQADLAVQEEPGVEFLTYWLDYERGVANCLVDATDPEAVNRAHAAAHGNLAGRVIPAHKDEILAFLGCTHDEGGPIDEPATRTIVFTDIVDSTAQLDLLGDEAGMASLREHNRIVRDVLASHRGRIVKSTGDGFMLAFDSPSDAVSFTIRLQQALLTHAESHPTSPIRVRIGINAGEPVARTEISTGSRSMWRRVSAAGRARARFLFLPWWRGLTMGKGVHFAEVRALELKGLTSSVTAFRVEFPVRGSTDSTG